MRVGVPGAVFALLLVAGCTSAPPPAPAATLSPEDAEWSGYPFANLSGPGSVQWELKAGVGAPIPVVSALIRVYGEVGVAYSGSVYNVTAIPVHALDDLAACGPVPPSVHEVPNDWTRKVANLTTGWYYVAALPRPFFRTSMITVHVKTGGRIFDMTNKMVPWIRGGTDQELSDPQFGPSRVDADATPKPVGAWLAWGTAWLQGDSPPVNAGYTHTFAFNESCSARSRTGTVAPQPGLPRPTLNSRLESSAAGPAGPLQASSFYAPEQDLSTRAKHTVTLAWFAVGDPTPPP